MKLRAKKAFAFHSIVKKWRHVMYQFEMKSQSDQNYQLMFPNCDVRKNICIFIISENSNHYSSIICYFEFVFWVSCFGYNLSCSVNISSSISFSSNRRKQIIKCILIWSQIALFYKMSIVVFNVDDMNRCYKTCLLNSVCYHLFLYTSEDDPSDLNHYIRVCFLLKIFFVVILFLCNFKKVTLKWTHRSKFSTFLLFNFDSGNSNRYMFSISVHRSSFGVFVDFTQQISILFLHRKYHAFSLVL